jgi:hypothetical protein
LASACSPGSTCCSPAVACPCARRTTTTARSPRVGAAAAVTAIGVAIGWWLVLIGFVAMLFATIGFVFEYYRGHFSH